MDHADLTSWTLVFGAAAGRDADRETFSRRYQGLIRTYFARRWHLPHEHHAVDDATQEAFVECFKAEGALSRVDADRPGGFRAFLHGVLRNVALMAERKRARSRDGKALDPSAIDALPADETTLSRVFDRAWAQTVVREARQLLRDRRVRSPAAARRYEALALRYEQAQPPREIATQLGLPVEAVYELLRVARVEFRSALMEVMAAYHPRSSERELAQGCADLLAALR